MRRGREQGSYNAPPDIACPFTTCSEYVFNRTHLFGAIEGHGTILKPKSRLADKVLPGRMLFYYFFVCFCKESLKLYFFSWAAGGSQPKPILKANYPSPEGYQQSKTHPAQIIQTLSAPRAGSPLGSRAGSLTPAAAGLQNPHPVPGWAYWGQQLAGTALLSHSSSCGDGNGTEKSCLCAPSFAAGAANLQFDITPH